MDCGRLRGGAADHRDRSIQRRPSAWSASPSGRATWPAPAG